MHLFGRQKKKRITSQDFVAIIQKIKEDILRAEFDLYVQVTSMYVAFICNIYLYISYAIWTLCPMKKLSLTQRLCYIWIYIYLYMPQARCVKGWYFSQKRCWCDTLYGVVFRGWTVQSQGRTASNDLSMYLCMYVCMYLSFYLSINVYAADIINRTCRTNKNQFQSMILPWQWFHAGTRSIYIEWFPASNIFVRAT